MRPLPLPHRQSCRDSDFRARRNSRKSGHRADFFFQDINALALQDVRHFTVGSSTCRTSESRRTDSTQAGKRPARARCRQNVHFSITPLDRGRFER